MHHVVGQVVVVAGHHEAPVGRNELLNQLTFED